MAKEKVEKCICGAPASLRVKERSLFGGKVVIKDYEFYRCERGHEYLEEAQMSKHDAEFRRQYFVQRHVIKTGRSLAITMPPDFAEFYNLKKGKKVTIVPAGRKEAILRFE